VGVLRRYMSIPGKENWTTIKRVFRYFSSTKDYDIFYQGKPRVDNKVDVHGFFDLDWDGYLNRRRSTSGYVLNMFDGAISWMSK
jgi:hypothetical protein